MMALNARTGKVDPGFGKEGSVALEVAYAGSPIVYKNLLFIGTNFYGPGDRHINPALDQRGGQVPEQHAYDVRTGKELWTFHTIPRDGEPGSKPGGQDSWKNRAGSCPGLRAHGGRGVHPPSRWWTCANFYGGDRPGKNLFGNALSRSTSNSGKIVVFQMVHHELGIGLPPRPADRHQERQQRFRLHAGKSGYIYPESRHYGTVCPMKSVPSKSNVPGGEFLIPRSRFLEAAPS
jgi:quinoprotein glucose dehydrogenase